MESQTLRQVELRPVASLVPYAKNARKHSEAQLDVLQRNIERVGWTNPILIDGNNGILAWHGRLMVAQRMGMTQVPVIELAGLSDEERRLIIISDNQIAAESTWDLDVLRTELVDLSNFGMDMSLTGFSMDGLAEIMGTKAGKTDPDAVPPIPDNPVSVLGDIWLLGKHRLMCGDSTKDDNVETLLAGQKPHLMVTDPPYGVNYDPDWRNRAERANGTCANGRAVGTVLNDDRSDWTDAWKLFPGEVAYCWHADRHASNTQTAFESCGFELRSQIIWAKQQFAIGRGHYHVQHEPCFYMVRKGTTGHWASDRKQTTLWEIPKPSKSETGHGTQKPVECMQRPIRNNSKVGDGIYDPFIGSGTTIIAAEQNGRICYAMELSPNYVDVAVTRWQDFTGDQATLESTGKTFAETKAERHAKS